MYPDAKQSLHCGRVVAQLSPNVSASWIHERRTRLDPLTAHSEMPRSVSSQQVASTSSSFVGWLARGRGLVGPIVDFVVGERWGIGEPEMLRGVTAP